MEKAIKEKKYPAGFMDLITIPELRRVTGFFTINWED